MNFLSFVTFINIKLPSLLNLMFVLLTKQIIINLLSYVLNKYFLKSDYIPDTVIIAENKTINKTHGPYSLGIYRECSYCYK